MHEIKELLNLKKYIFELFYYFKNPNNKIIYRNLKFNLKNIYEINVIKKV